MKSPPLSASFRAATEAVAIVLAGRTPDALLARIEPALRPSVLDLVFTTLRDCGRGDFLLDRLLAKPLKNKTPPENSAARSSPPGGPRNTWGGPACSLKEEIRALLLVALARLERRPDEAHTIVDQAVTAADKRFKGLMNAVLRNFLRRRDELLAAADVDPVAHWRHPHWWLEKLRTAFPENWQEVAAAGNSHPPLCLRINHRHPLANTASTDLCAELATVGSTARVLDATALLLDKPLPVERIPGFREGRLSVQDWGAQQAAILLDVQDGQRVLDACAAPGGKATHLLELADLDLTALELDPQRARRIEQNLARLGLTATLAVGDASRPADWWDGRPFDRILADLPCSASGVVRRHPDIKWLRRATDVAGFAQTQAAILDALWPLLAPGGKMLYCTCSVFPEENGDQVRAFVLRHPTARRLPTGGAANELQLLPSFVQHATHDGFYYALLEKTL